MSAKSTIEPISVAVLTSPARFFAVRYASATATSAKTTRINTALKTRRATLTAPANNASYNTGATITLSANAADSDGTVTQVQWRNPHTYFYVDVADEKGAVHNWALELGSPNGLTRAGWTRDTLKIGDTITVEGSRARDNSYKANASNVKLANGKRLFNGKNEDDAGAAAK